MLLVKARAAKSPIHGIGLFAMEHIPPGRPIWRFVSGFDVLVTEAEAACLSESAREQLEWYGYLHEATRTWVLSSDDDRFTNHSDDPNTVIQDDMVVASRPIRPNEEILCNYDDLAKLNYSLMDSQCSDLDRPSDVLGWHIVADFWGCNPEIDNAVFVERAVRDAAAASQSTTLHFALHQFQPHGVTAFALLSGSHLSVHSWPEHRYLAADIYVCGPTTDPAAAVELLRSRFQPERVDCRRLSRGVLPQQPLSQEVLTTNALSNGLALQGVIGESTAVYS